MTFPTALPMTMMICPQGHGPGVPGTHFCNWCGAALVMPAPVAAAPYPAVMPVPPPPVAALCSACGGGGKSDGDDVLGHFVSPER